MIVLSLMVLNKLDLSGLDTVRVGVPTVRTQLTTYADVSTMRAKADVDKFDLIVVETAAAAINEEIKNAVVANKKTMYINRLITTVHTITLAPISKEQLVVQSAIGFC